MTSKAGTRYTIRGSQAAPSSAPLGSKKKGVLKKQMVVTDDGEDVFFKLPGSKKRQSKNKHNLMEAVKNARGAEKNTSLVFDLSFEW